MNSPTKSPKKKLRKVVIAFSGGMDSTVLVHQAARDGFDEIHTISFDYGQRHERELDCVQDQLGDILARHPEIKVYNKTLDVKYIKDIAPTSSLTNMAIDTPDINEMAGDAQPASYVPFRNMMFLSICCSYAEGHDCDTVWYGAAGVDSMAGYWDCDKNFVDTVNALISLNRMNGITIEAPLIDMSKEEITLAGIKMGIDFKKTWTCYSNHATGLADATTSSSSLRVQGFIDAGYRDPLQYIQQIKLDKLYEENDCAFLT